MFKALVLAIVLIPPTCIYANAQSDKAKEQQPSAAQLEADNADKSVCIDNNVPPAPTAKIKKDKKDKYSTLGGKVAPLGLVVCEVENALNAYQQSDDVDSKLLPAIATADLDFKTVVDNKGQLGVGLFFVKLLGGSVDKQKTDEVDFQYVPKSLLKTGFEARRAATFQEELIAVIKNAAKAVKEQESLPTSPNIKDPLVLKQLTVTVSFGVTTTGTIGLAIPIHIVTLTAELDHTKNAVNSVKLVFAPAPKKGGVKED